MDKIKFLHFRRQDGVNGISNLGGVTVAYQRINAYEIKIAYAYCHPKDNFNKAIGRVKAAGRLNSRHNSMILHYTSDLAYIEDEKKVLYPFKLKENI